jgi:putative transposase
MAADFRIAAVRDALAKPGPPDIFNPDQGRQFTGAAFTGVLRKSGIAIGDRITERDRFGSP